MDFNQFLDYFKKTNRIKSTASLYEFLGGADSIGIKYRQFVSIENGKSLPNEEILLAVFKKVKPQDTSLLLKSFFKSRLGGMKGADSFLSYLHSNVETPLMKREESLWDNNISKRPLYTDKQLDFLLENEMALKYYKRLLLYEKLDITNVDESIYRSFMSLNLATKQGSLLIPSKTLYKVPKDKNEGGPRTRERATKYVLKHIDAFISYEGSENQSVGYFFGLFRPEVAEKIIDQAESLKKWIQNESLEKPQEGAVPVVFVTFTKKLSEGEI